VSFGPQLLIPGLHEPVQLVFAPVPLQTLVQISAVSRQTPIASHCCICGAEGLHRLSPGTQPVPVPGDESD
jgi:hypothetical protein